jgi:hypothetical protein
MRTVLVVALASCLAWAAGEYMAVNPINPLASAKSPPNNPAMIELSHDNGNIQNAWVYLTGANTYAGDQYDNGLIFYLSAIKYYVWTGWPDSTFQGFAVACWKMDGGTPGSVVWPTDGNPIYNPNTGGNWIIQDTGWFDIGYAAPEGFVVGIGFLYSYPAMDAFGVDNTGVSPWDWSYVGGAWGAAPYGVGSARAIQYSMPVEPISLGSLRALYR